ncbi:MAG: hypothetical protein IPJ30_19360 [Acidobacteria bacterium]|nr:hypothetical protein [Acidobacteriota bacterium]
MRYAESGYDMGITVTRYPHVFSNKIVDFNPKRMIMETNRCILCRRCVEEVKTVDGNDVFSFVNRGKDGRQDRLRAGSKAHGKRGDAGYESLPGRRDPRQGDDP